MKSLNFSLVKEDGPDEKFRQLFEQNWPAYRAWYLDEGEAARPTYLECLSAIKEYMPELFPLYKRLTDLVGGDDLKARFLSLYCPPPFYSGCSQLALNHNQSSPTLIRNYDFPPILCEGVIYSSRWMGRNVVAMADCVWGALDGMNDSGLAISIAYGGRLVKGEGFGITIVIRYILETCTSVEDAIDVFHRIPIHLDYNITMIDKTGRQATVYIAPDRVVRITNDVAATNHQDNVDPSEPLFLEDSLIRLNALNEIANEAVPFKQEPALSFLYPPLYRSHQLYESGTLYTAAYFPKEGLVRYIWPETSIEIDMSCIDQVREQEKAITYCH